MSLTARHLEAHGIPTVILGSARDVVEHCAVPRFLFTDFPLGNPCGRPGDTSQQRQTVNAAFDLLEGAQAPLTTVLMNQRWAPGEVGGEADRAWRASYMRVHDGNRAALSQAGAQRRAQRADARD